MSGSKLITELGARIGISDLALDEEHTCGVMFDDEFFFECQHGNLFIMAEIDRVEEKDERVALFSKFMYANHLGHATGFGSIGYDPEREGVTLTRIVDEDLEYQKFEEQMTLFVNCLDPLWGGAID